MTLTKSDRTKIIEELKPFLFTKDAKNEFKNALIEEMQEVFATKESLTQLRQDMLGDKAEILGAINKKSEDDDAHKMLHHNLGEDVPDLQRQVKHLYTTFEIDMPVSPAY